MGVLDIVGRGLGAFGGFLEGLPGESAFADPLRDIGGQLASGQRTFNLAPPVRADFSQPVIDFPTAEAIQRGVTSPEVLGTTDSAGGATGTVATTGGGGGDTGNGAPSIDPFLQAIEDAAASRLGFLGRAEQRIRGDFPTAQQEVAEQFAASRGEVEREKGAAERQLELATTGGEQRREDAVAAARRLFNELRIGGMQRFGGASTAGEAFGELSAREFQRNRAQIAQDFTNFMQNVQVQRANLQDRFVSAVANLEAQKNRALNNVKREFQDRLSEIDRLRAETEADKANMRLAALQDLRNQVFQINLAETQLRGSVEAQKQQAEQELESAFQAFTQSATGGTEALQGLLGSTTTSPKTALAITSGQTQQQLPVGRIKKEEEPEGIITPRRREEESFAFA